MAPTVGAGIGATGADDAAAKKPAAPIEDASLCRGGGWQTLLRADGLTGFVSQKDCQSYVRTGGTFGTAPPPPPPPPPATPSEACTAVGGTYQVGTTTGLLWTCSDYISDDEKRRALVDACFFSGGSATSFSATVPEQAQCFD